jgi:predicted Zn-dependent protease
LEWGFSTAEKAVLVGRARLETTPVASGGAERAQRRGRSNQSCVATTMDSRKRFRPGSPEAAEFQRAIDLKSAGQLTEAATVMEGMAGRFPENPTLLGTLGGVYFLMGEDALAAEYAAACSRLVPHKEAPSLILYHALRRLGREREAIRELLRFIAIDPQQSDYAEILEEMLTHEYYRVLIEEERRG